MPLTQLINSYLQQKYATHQLIILGLAREGWSTYQFLRDILPTQPITLADQHEIGQLDSQWQKAIQQDQYLQLLLGDKHLDCLSQPGAEQPDQQPGQHQNQQPIIFKAPGIPSHLPPIQNAIQAGATLTSNTQLFFDLIQLLNQQPWPTAQQFNPKLPMITIVGVTGTKGKSTTASLIFQLLHSNQIPSILAGNIGKPALTVLPALVDHLYHPGQPDGHSGLHPTDQPGHPNSHPTNHLAQPAVQTAVILELSCHQLADLTSSPHVAVVQNITSEHLDYYPDTQAYLAAKQAITKYQKVNDYVIYNPQLAGAVAIAQLSPGRTLLHAISSQPTNSQNSDLEVYIKDYYLIDNHSQKTIDLNKISLIGLHNWHNILPAVIVAKLCQLNFDQIAIALQNFKPLAHRLELVAEINRVRYYNDSLATLPDATIAAMQAFNDQELILIAGGYERHQDFAQLAKQILKQKVKALILFPTTGQRLWADVQKLLDHAQDPPQAHLSHYFVTSMTAAVDQAYQLAKPNTVVLLSPASASFGTFKDYQDRGDQFKKAVLAAKDQTK